MTSADHGNPGYGLEPLDGGYSGETFLAHTEEGDEVVRVYGRQPERCMIDAALLRLLAGVIPVATVRDVRPPTASQPGVMVSSRLPGVPLDQVLRSLDDGRQSTLGTNLGQLLARLSGIPQPRFGFFSGPELAVIGDPGVPDTLRDWAEASSTGRLAGWDPDNWFRLLELTDAADDLLASALPARHVLTHGDFNPKNILVDPASLEVTGLVDWEYAHAGSPYADLGNLTRFERHPDFVAAVVEALVTWAPPLAAHPLELARAADCWAVLELAGREAPNAVSELAGELLLAQATSGDLSAWPWPTTRVDPTVDTHVSW